MKLLWLAGVCALIALSGAALGQLGPAAPAATPASPQGPGATQAPQIQLPPVQTPTITNQPQQQQAPREPQRAAPPAAAPTAPRPAAPAPLESAASNEFQEFVAATIGRTLPLFGYDLFQGVPSTFAPVENIPVTPDYVVGPGDELLVRAWGQIDMEYRTTVDRNGAINIPRVGVINVAGIKYQDLTAYVKTAVARNFRNFELIVTMGQLRSVQILVVGQARRPGNYTVSSLSTLVNAIFAAGGPSGRGSMRAIQLKRGNSVVAEIDLYDLLVSGDKSKDAPLLPGDVIYFPPAGPLVALSGSVSTPAIFELKGPTSVGRLLELAGGLTTTAQTRRASIERIDERKTRTVDQFALDYDGLRRTVKDGDLLAVFSVSPRFENAVTLRGKVAAPLRYPYAPGMRVKDLIPERDALITPDYYVRKNLAARVDTVAQGRLAYDVRRLADEINWDYAVIERLNKGDLTAQLIPFDLGKAVLEADPAHNLPLLPEDIVTVFSKADVGASVAKRTAVVSLEGEFNVAGVYQAQPGETIRQLVARVGGLASGAYLFGAEFTRESVRAQQQRSYEETLNRIERDLQSQTAERARSSLSPEDVESLKVAAASQQATIARLRGLKPTGRIVLELPEDAKLADLPHLAIEDGDRVFVPARPAIVSVFGSVFTEGSFLHRPGRSVSDYLALAGGPTIRANTSQMFVLRADGSAAGQSGSIFGFSSVRSTSVMPGDTIVVPEDFERQTWTKTLKDWTQILYQFGLGAAGITVLRGN